MADDRPPYLRCKHCGSEFDGIFTHEKFLREHDAVCFGRRGGTEVNVTEKIMKQLGIERRPRSEWTDEQKIRFDRLVYGTGVGRRRPDGSLEHIPFEELVFEVNR